MGSVRLELHHDPRLVPGDLAGLPPEVLLRRALRSLRRRFGWVVLSLEPTTEAQRHGEDKHGGEDCRDEKLAGAPVPRVDGGA